MSAMAKDHGVPQNAGIPLVLLVEDELLIAECIHSTLIDHGFEVLGPVATVEQARELMAERRPDLALIDYRLARGTTEPLLKDLKALLIPACVLTGYGKRQLPCTYDGYPVLEKPFRNADLIAAITQLRDVDP